jgi:replication fork clamp-binding protein CrfC
MDKGTDALDVLQGAVVPLRLGYIGVVLRSQKDINENKPISDAIKNEKFYFSNHATYRKVANRCGTPFLSQTLNKVQKNRSFC